MSHQCSVFYRTQIVSLRPRQFQGRSCSHDNNSLQWSITAINRQSIMQLIYMNSNVKMELDMQLQCPAASNVLRTVRTSPVRLTSATTTFAFSHSPRQYENSVFLSKIKTKKRTSLTKINQMKVKCARYYLTVFLCILSIFIEFWYILDYQCRVNQLGNHPTLS